MTRFYGKGVSDDETPSVFFITVTCNSRYIDVEVTEELFDELDDMQREYWRLERKEARHTKLNHPGFSGELYFSQQRGDSRWKAKNTSTEKMAKNPGNTHQNLKSKPS
ncbi:MAG: hypothetical protein VB027_02725, partial [Gordonibacter sp.]|nr:hypothetical protein [Gordonibacter sp.]